MKRIDLLLAGLLAGLPVGAQTTAICFRSTDGNYWKMSMVQVADKVVGKPAVVIRPDEPAQTFYGWGTTFNELGWDAYNLLPMAEKELFAKRVFHPEGDLRITVGRIPVGASDYARDWYSCNETEGDFEMKHFSIERDLTTIIPSIKVAQNQNPRMMFWASPWSPPQWMKTNKHYAQRMTPTNGCPFNVPPYFNDQFIGAEEYYQAYCLYFDKFINAYKEQGIPIYALAYQNEAYSNTPYPGCSWTAETTGKFLGRYLGPYLAEHQPGVKLIVGTMNTASLDVYEQILNSDGVAEYCKQIGFQWEGGVQINEVMKRHPGYEAVMTESECGSGTFDWNAAAHTFKLINHYLANRVTTYTYWNTILKDNGVSTWGWRQNALIQVNSSTNTPRYTAEYYAFKHYSHLIPPGSRILTVDNARLVLSAMTPGGAIIVVAGNDEATEKTLTMDVDGKYLVAKLPAKSFTSYVLGDAEAMKQVLLSEAKGLVAVEAASLTGEQVSALNKAIDSSDMGLLVQAVGDAESDKGTTAVHDTLRNPSFTDGLDSWMTKNISKGGDYRTNNIVGRTCWNSWSNNFTSMDIYQDLWGLEPGVYTVSCVSMCGPEEISDQHAYAIAQCDTAVSPVKKVAIWNKVEGWELQETGKVVVGTDRTLRVGYASVSGGGTKGWFCVSDFKLQKTEGNDAEAVSIALEGAIAKAEAMGSMLPAEVVDAAKTATGYSQQLQALTDLRRAITNASVTLDFTAYYTEKAKAEEIMYKGIYSEEACTALGKLIAEQARILAMLTEQASVDDLVRQLDEEIAKVKLTEKSGDSVDFSFLIVNPGAEAETGWALSLTNGDAKIKRGQHYSGNKSDTYFDSYNAVAGNLWYTGRQTIRNIPSGVYRLVAKARTDGDGVYITAETDSLYKVAVINDGNGAGKGSLGNGWNEFVIDGIKVSEHVLTIGFTNDCYLTKGQKFTGTWFSVDDFQLFYLPSVPVTAVRVTGDTTGCIPEVYNLNGVKVSGMHAKGVYIVKEESGAARKVLVF